MEAVEAVLVLVLVLEDLLALSQSVVLMHIFSVGESTQNLHNYYPIQDMDSIHHRLIEFVAVAIV